MKLARKTKKQEQIQSKKSLQATAPLICPRLNEPVPLISQEQVQPPLDSRPEPSINLEQEQRRVNAIDLASIRDTQMLREQMLPFLNERHHRIHAIPEQQDLRRTVQEELDFLRTIQDPGERERFRETMARTRPRELLRTNSRGAITTNIQLARNRFDLGGIFFHQLLTALHQIMFVIWLVVRLMGIDFTVWQFIKIIFLFPPSIILDRSPHLANGPPRLRRLVHNRGGRIPSMVDTLLMMIYYMGHLNRQTGHDLLQFMNEFLSGNIILFCLVGSMAYICFAYVFGLIKSLI